MALTEEIGAVRLDLSEYSGEDLYSEGESEDRLLDIVREHEPGEFNHLINANPGWSFLYHLSDIRGNIVDFLPLEKTDKVLEVGSGCGAITGTLAKKAGSVTCVELSKKRSMINACRNKKQDNIEIRVGNFQDIEKKLDRDYDYIMLIGVFEYAASYISSGDPYREFLDILLGHLKEGGSLFIAIENKYGLKYFSGCREDHLGTFYGSITGYDPDAGVRTFSRDSLLAMAERSGCSVREYYPYPDYKLPVVVFSDRRLPHRGELSGSSLNFDASRVIAFDEGEAFDEIISDGMFPFFSNSFLFELVKGAESSASALSEERPRVIYSKHSNERADSFAIRTDIIEYPSGERRVVKYPRCSPARDHIASLGRKYELLKEQYRNTPLEPNVYSSAGEGAQFEYLEGMSLEKELSELVGEGRKDEALALVDEYAAIISSLSVDGMIPNPNLDLIFSNIIRRDGTWHVVDYEWTFEEAVPEKYILFRAVRYFLAETPRAASLGLYERFGIDAALRAGFEEREKTLQKLIAGDRLSLITFYSIFGQTAYPLQTLLDQSSRYGRIDRIKLYFDKGEGFTEYNSCYFNGEVSEINKVTFNIPIESDLVKLRVDPSDDPCMLQLLESDIDGGDVNGIAINRNTVIFKEPDPQIIFDTLNYTAKTMRLSYRIEFVDSAFFNELGIMALKEKERREKRLFGRREENEKIFL